MDYKYKFFYSYNGILDLEKKANDWFKENKSACLFKPVLAVDFSRGEPFCTLFIQYFEMRSEARTYDSKFRFFYEKTNLNTLADRIEQHFNQDKSKEIFVNHIDQKMSMATGSGTPVTVVMVQYTEMDKVQTGKPEVVPIKEKKQEKLKAEVTATETIESVEEEVPLDEVVEETPSRQPVFFKTNNELVDKIANKEVQL